jgi:hypothetical protein
MVHASNCPMRRATQALSARCKKPAYESTGVLSSGGDHSRFNHLDSSCSLRVPAVTDDTAHRPWPLPKSRWILFMRWHDLVFLHWPIRPERLKPVIPIQLELDAFDAIMLDWCCSVLHERSPAAICSCANGIARAERSDLCKDDGQERRVVFQS